MSTSKWKTVSSSYVHQNPWYKIRQDKVIRPDGKQGTYNVLEKPESVFVIPLTTDQRIMLTSLYRYTTGRSGWELPCGGVEPGESTLQAAQRELQEETSYTSNNLQYVGNFDSMNGITDSKSHVYTARNLAWTAVNDQTAEGITATTAFTHNEIMELIAHNKMVDGLSIAAYMKFMATQAATT